MARYDFLDRLVDDRGVPRKLQKSPKGSFEDGSFRLTGVVRTKPRKRDTHDDRVCRFVFASRRLVRMVDGTRSQRLVLITASGLWLVLLPVLVWRLGTDKLGVLAALTLAAIVLIWLAAWEHGHQIRKLRRGLRDLPPGCLSCWYDLSATTPAPDGCTVCPECGGAWRFDRADPTPSDETTNPAG